jgi:hypothetical protein|tara:strand:+ start:674 stop:1087 length:414 start_codon:yes stop_codon:yes gene_type:complete
MSSNDTVTGNSLQFTNDNKRCFAYSGVNAFVDNTETTLLEFETLDSDLDGTVQFNMVQDTADDMFYRIRINDIVVMGYLTIGAQQGTDANNVIPIIFPPYSRIKLTAQNASTTGTRSNICAFVGKVGIPQRVGNLDE